MNPLLRLYTAKLALSIVQDLWVHSSLLCNPNCEPLGSGGLFTLDTQHERSLSGASLQRSSPILKSFRLALT